MIGVGYSLDDLGIDPEGEKSRVPVCPSPEEDREPYDFTLHRLALGSWQEVRDCLFYEAERHGKGFPLWFTLHWSEVESETEASIKERLNALRYPRWYRWVFDDYICSWADDPHAEPLPDDLQPEPRWEHAPKQDPTPDVGPAVTAEALRAYLGHLPADSLEPVGVRLLGNLHLSPSLVRVTCELLLETHPWSVWHIAQATADLPADVIESILGIDGAQEKLIEREHLDPQTLLALIGKCDRASILAHPSCTESVRAEIERVAGTDQVLSTYERREAAAALQTAREDISSGRLQGWWQRQAVAEAVCANPTMGLYDIHCFIKERQWF